MIEAVEAFGKVYDEWFNSELPYDPDKEFAGSSFGEAIIALSQSVVETELTGIYEMWYAIQIDNFLMEIVKWGEQNDHTRDIYGTEEMWHALALCRRSKEPQAKPSNKLPESIANMHSRDGKTFDMIAAEVGLYDDDGNPDARKAEQEFMQPGSVIDLDKHVMPIRKRWEDKIRKEYQERMKDIEHEQAVFEQKKAEERPLLKAGPEDIMDLAREPNATAEGIKQVGEYEEYDEEGNRVRKFKWTLEECQDALKASRGDNPYAPQQHNERLQGLETYAAFADVNDQVKSMSEDGVRSKTHCSGAQTAAPKLNPYKSGRNLGRHKPAADAYRKIRKTNRHR